MIFFHIANIAGMVVATIARLFFISPEIFPLHIALGIYVIIGPIFFALYMYFVKKRPKIAILYLSFLLGGHFFIAITGLYTGLYDVATSRRFFDNRPDIEAYKSTCFQSEQYSATRQILMFCEKITYKGGLIIDIFYDETGEIAYPPASRSDDWNRAFGLLASSAIASEIYKIEQGVDWTYVQMDVRALGRGFYAVSYRI